MSLAFLSLLTLSFVRVDANSLSSQRQENFTLVAFMRIPMCLQLQGASAFLEGFINISTLSIH